MWLVRQDGEDMDVDWPSRATLRGKSISGEEEPIHARWTEEVTCPPASLPDQVELRVGEALWAAEDGGGEFVELENQSGFPLDLSGLQATESSDPDPADWEVWVGEGRSLILETGHVMHLDGARAGFAGVTIRRGLRVGLWKNGQPFRMTRAISPSGCLPKGRRHWTRCRGIPGSADRGGGGRKGGLGTEWAPMRTRGRLQRMGGRPAGWMEWSPWSALAPMCPWPFSGDSTVRLRCGGGFLQLGMAPSFG